MKYLKFLAVPVSLLASLLSGCVFQLPMSARQPSAANDAEVDFLAPGESGERYFLSRVGSVNRNVGPADFSAITFVSNDTYWAAADSGGVVCELTIPVDRATGRIAGCGLGRTMKLEGCLDVEGLAFDPLAYRLWASDEVGSRISGHRLRDGARVLDLPVPSCYSQCRPNLSLEALTIREDGLEMWTCNESPLACDGELSSRRRTSLVRLSRFVRANGFSPWRAAGQWAYPVGRVHGGPLRGILARGVSDLCVLPDGTLLSLEREFSWNVLPCFRYRIYQIYFAGATDISSLKGLAASDIEPVRRRRLWADDTTFSNYEGMCLGPRLDDGSRLLLLISDGDDRANADLCSFKLYR